MERIRQYRRAITIETLNRLTFLITNKRWGSWLEVGQLPFLRGHVKKLLREESEDCYA
jgi:hypothetical protein